MQSDQPSSGPACRRRLSCFFLRQEGLTVVAVVHCCGRPFADRADASLAQPVT